MEGLFLCLLHTLLFYHIGSAKGLQDSREFMLDLDSASLAEIIARFQCSAAVRAEFVLIGGPKYMIGSINICTWIGSEWVIPISVAPGGPWLYVPID